MKVYVVLICKGVWNEFDNFAVYREKQDAQEFIDGYEEEYADDDLSCYLYERTI